MLLVISLASMEDNTTHKKMLHSKRSSGMAKYPHIDSPAYDASEGKTSIVYTLLDKLMLGFYRG